MSTQLNAKSRLTADSDAVDAHKLAWSKDALKSAIKEAKDLVKSLETASTSIGGDSTLSPPTS